MTAVVSRQQWGAAYGEGRMHPLTGIVGHVVIHHTAGPSAYADAAAEADEVRAIERYHTVVRGWPGGIGYSFLVAPSGRAYEGRGWGKVGAHTHGYNSSSYGICLMGNGETEPAPPRAWAAVRGLIESGIRTGRLTPSPRVTGHRDHAATACPGTHNYRLLDLLDGITGTGAELEDDDMPLSERDFDRLEGMIRRILGEAVGPGQRTWPGTVAATLDGVHQTFNYARSTHQRLEAVEGELAAARAALERLTGQDASATQVLDRQ